MLSQQQIEAIILYHLYGESEAAAKRFREAVTNAASEIAAQQSVHRIGGDAPLEDSPFETGIRRGAVVLPPANR